MSEILTIDIGTSSMRGVLFDSKGLVLSVIQKEYIPIFKENGEVEQDPYTWKSILDNILCHMGMYSKRHNIDIKGISITSQRSSVIAVDRHGQSLYNAIMWQDRRTLKLCKELESHNQMVYDKCGMKISPVFSAVKMLWLKQNQREIYDKTYKMMGIHDYILYLLTGKFLTDESLASRTNLFNICDRVWDDKLIEIFKLDKSKLCDVIKPGSVAGKLNEELANKWGLKSNIKIISAGGDQQCAALGLGVMDRGEAVVNTGTGSYVIGHIDEPVFDDKMRTICNISAIPGKYILEAGTLTSGIIYSWYNQEFYKTNKKIEHSYLKINKEVELSPVGARGVILLPHFKGAGAPNWNPYAKGIFYNVTLETKRGDMARAILEGIALEMAGNIHLLEGLSGKIDKISVAGGLTKLATYNQIIADTFNKSILKSPIEEATALGAFISAAVTLTFFDNYQEAFNICYHNKVTKEINPIIENVEQYKLQKSQKDEVYNLISQINK